MNKTNVNLYENQLSLLSESSLFRVEKIIEGKTDQFFKNWKEFYDECYIPFEKEKEIINNIFQESLLVCLVGQRGCGKTTLLYKMLNEDCPKNYCYILIDFYKEGELKSKLDAKNPITFMNALKEKVRDRVLTHFYSLNNEQREYLNKLSIEFLKDPTEKTIPFLDLYEDFTSMRNHAQELFKLEKSKINFDYWVTQNEITSGYIQSIEKSLTLKHLVWGLKHFNRFEKLIIVFDNVDELPNFIQPYYFRYTIEVYKMIRGFSNCVITIRRENIKHIKEHGSHQDANVVCFQYLDNQEKKLEFKQKAIYKIPKLIDEVAIEIIEKRLNFAIKKDLEKIVKTIDDEETIKKITKKRWGFIKSITKMIKTTYIDEKIAYLANENCRIILIIYSNLIDYFLKNKMEEMKSILKYPLEKKNRNFQSYFYSWLIQKGEDVSLKIYNLVDLYERLKKYKEKREEKRIDKFISKGGLGCFPEYLILVYLYNKKLKIEENKNKEYFFTDFNEIKNELYNLGFSDFEIREALINLYLGYRDKKGHMIDMRMPLIEKIEPKNIMKDTQIWLLPRGEIVCLETAHKYTCVIEQIYSKYYRKFHKANEIDLVKIESEHIIWDVKFLVGIANMHLESLDRIRSNSIEMKRDNNWFKKYLKIFTIKKTLHLPRIINYHIIFLEAFCDNELEYLNNRYLRKNLSKENKDGIHKLIEHIKETKKTIKYLKELRRVYLNQVKRIIANEDYSKIYCNNFFKAKDKKLFCNNCINSPISDCKYITKTNKQII